MTPAEKPHFHDNIAKIKSMCDAPYAFIDEIPEVLQKDFKAFNVGRGISQIDGRWVTYDLERYYHKIMFGNGVSYAIEWQPGSIH